MKPIERRARPIKVIKHGKFSKLATSKSPSKVPQLPEKPGGDPMLLYLIKQNEKMLNKQSNPSNPITIVNKIIMLIDPHTKLGQFLLAIIVLAMVGAGLLYVVKYVGLI